MAEGQSSATESKSWASTEKAKAAGCYTHNTRNFTVRDVEPVVVAQEEAEPALPPAPTWMLVLAGAAIATLMGVLVGGLFLEF
nr:hypothetical protein [uncultured Brevundimonas sp.]